MKKYLYITFITALAITLQKDVNVLAKIYNSSPPTKVQSTQSAGKSKTSGTTTYKTVRITDSTDSENSIVNHSNNSSFNLDSTRFIVNIDGVYTLYSFDPDRLSARKEGPLFSSSMPQFNGLHWAADDPDTLICISEGKNPQSPAQIYSYNVISKQSRLIKDFSGTLAGGETRLLSKSQSDDDQLIFAWRESSSLPWRYVVLWESTSDKTYLFDLTDPISGVPGFTGAQLDRTGQKLIVNGEFSRVWQYKNQPQHYSERTGSDLTGINQLYAASPSPADLQIQDISSVFATNRNIYTGVESVSISQSGWVSAAGTSVYRKSISAMANRNAGEAIFLNWNGQELLRSDSLQLDAGKWFFDQSSGEIYLRLPNDSVPGSDSALALGVRKSSEVEVIRLARNTGSSAEILSDHGYVWKDAPHLRGNISPDGRFFIFNSKADQKKSDIFITAITTQSVTEEPVEWTNAVNCTVMENSLVKNGGASTEEDAGALSLQTIESGDGAVEFTASEKNTNRFLGLTTQFVAPAASSDVDFGIRLDNNKKLLVVEKGIAKKTTIKYTIGDTFKIALQGGVVKYYKNSKLIYTSREVPTYPLLTAASLTSSGAKIDSAMITGATTLARVSIFPNRVTISANQSRQFTTTITGTKDPRVVWSTTGGTVSSTGFYTAPASAGIFTVTVSLLSDSSVRALAVVTVIGAADTTPPAISSVTAINLTSNSGTVSWATNEASDTQVEYGTTTSYGSASPLNTSMVTAHSATLSGLAANTTYNYRVKSRDAAGNLVTSGNFTFRTASAADTTPPTISQVASSNVTHNSATVTWTTNEASDTQVQYGTTTSYGSSSPLNSAMITAHSVSLTGLAANTTYNYRVRSRDAAGNLATSGNFTFRTTATPDTTPPTISQVASSNVTHNSATVTWTTNEASNTQVEYGTTTSYGSASPINSAMVTAHSTALSGLAANTTYNYRVKSRDAAGNLATSGNFTFRTSTAPDTTPPTISQVASSNVTHNSATVTWTTNEASNTQVEYGTTTSYGSASPLNTSMVTAHSATLSGLAANTTYNYRVRSRDAAGNLATSGNFTFRTSIAADTTPPTISSVTATNISATGATVNWTTNESSDTQVEYGTTTSYGSSTPLPTPMSTGHSANLTGLSANTTYNYRVKSRDAAGNLATSANFTFRTATAPPPPTSGLVAAYNFNEGTGTTVTDASGNGQNGTVSGATWSAQGKYGKALSFDGTNDWVTVTDSNLLDLSTGMTLSAWVFSTATSGTRDIMIKEGSGVDIYNLYARNWQGNPESNAFIGGSNRTAVGSALATNTWVHIAGTYDGATLRLFINGVQAASSSVTGPITISTGVLRIGGNSMWGEHFQGSIDDVRVYNRALSASEIQADMSSQVGGSTPPSDTSAPVISGVGASGMTTSGANVSWATNEASDTQVEYGTTTSYGSSSPLNTSMVTAHSATLSGLAAGTTYNYRVKSRDAAGNLATSGNFTFTTSSPPADTTPPTISQVAASNLSTNGATINWTTNEASNTQVEYGTTTGYGSSSPLNTSMVTAHSATLSGLAANTTYNYRVKSRDAAGNLATSGNFTFTTTAAAPPTGCPGFTIEGFGRNATGGCGGTVFTVTNLNDSGPGSFRDFVNRSGPRIIRFAVSGTITLLSDLEVTNGDLTVDGSTAPNQGVCVRGSGTPPNEVGTFAIKANNVIIRYMRFRIGNLGGSSRDSLRLFGCSNTVIDHCSLSWGDDGNLDIMNSTRDITVQWCLLSENMGAGANLIGDTTTRVTLHHNLYYNSGRMAEIDAGDFDFVNNVIYRNYIPDSIHRYFENLTQVAPWFPSPIRVNLVGNYYKPGGSENVSSNKKAIYLYGAREFSAQAMVYLKGNIGPSRTSDSMAEMDIASQDDGGLAISPTRFGHPQVTTTTAQVAYTQVLANVGATLPCRDAVDRRVLNNVANGTGAVPWSGYDPQMGIYPDLSQPCSISQSSFEIDSPNSSRIAVASPPHSPNQARTAKSKQMSMTKRLSDLSASKSFLGKDRRIMLGAVEKVRFDWGLDRRSRLHDFNHKARARAPRYTRLSSRLSLIDHDRKRLRV